MLQSSCNFEMQFYLKVKYKIYLFPLGIALEHLHSFNKVEIKTESSIWTHCSAKSDHTVKLGSAEQIWIKILLPRSLFFS